MSNINATTPQLKLVKGWIDAYLSRDIKNIQPHLSKNYKFQTFPKIAGLPDETTEGYVEKYRPIFSMFTDLQIHAHEVIEAPGKVVLQVSAVCSTIDGTTLEYDCVAVLTIVEEDEKLKILEFKDFSNPEQRSTLHSWAAKALAKGGHVA